MTKKRFLLALALMLTAVGGAWAQGEVLLTTVNSNENTGFTSGSQSFDGVATVTFSQSVNNQGDGWGWFRGNETTITVTAANNDFTITKVKFYCSEGSAFDEEAPFEAIVKYEGGDNIAKVNGTSIGRYGVTKIEVYGTAPLLNWNAATKTGSLTTPAGNVTLTVDYYGQYTLDSVPLDWQVKVGTAAPVSPTAYTTGNTQLGHVDNINETDSVELVPPAELRGTIKSVTLVEAAAVEGHALADAVVGEIVGTDGQAYAVADKDNLPEGVTAAGMVAYKSGSNGLVIALTDEASEMNWSTANGATTGAAAHTPAVTGQTWKLPSQAEWNQMFSANGGNEGSYTGLNTAITNAGGTALQGNVSYWSSTENYTGYYANRVSLYNGDASWLNADERNDYRVRAVLAF